jgi:purine nucleosidase
VTDAPQLRLAVQSRVVVDNDWAGDPDGLVALAHHLLAPTNRVVAVTSSLLNPVFGQGESTAARGAEMAAELVDLVGGVARPAVHVGAETPFEPSGSASAASAAIVAEARRDDDVPLFLVCAGPLTNVAAALEEAPEIAARLTLVWVGGAVGPAAFEYNRDTDAAAAEFVFGRPELAIWQFPLETYRRCAYSVAELEHDLAASGRVGAWLWSRFLELPLPEWVEQGGVWPLGDSPPVLVTALSDESSAYTTAPGHGPGERRVYTDVDVRLLVGDLLARLRGHERSQAPGSWPLPRAGE